MRIVTPDFSNHPWRPLSNLEMDGNFVVLTWTDGRQFAAHKFWLAENAEGIGLDPQTRESVLSPLGFEDIEALDCRVGAHGELLLRWTQGRSGRIHPGWLRNVADGHHDVDRGLPEPTSWMPAQTEEFLNVSGDPENREIMIRWLNHLVRYGVCRLVDLGTSETVLADVMRRIGPIRGSNFGDLFVVTTKTSPDSTAYTGVALGQHTDLPTRETPPGFQFLHCLENSASGGEARLTDGLAVVDALREEQPQVLDSLTRDEWIFINRARDADHRFKAPVCRTSRAGRPLTLRAFYPVRSAPAMAEDRIELAYDALHVFQRYVEDERFCLTLPYRPGDLLGFDNRRILHGRTKISATGRRKLIGCYMDRDEVLSALRVMTRQRVG